jgi:hypothetical protein
LLVPPPPPPISFVAEREVPMCALLEGNVLKDLTNPGDPELFFVIFEK